MVDRLQYQIRDDNNDQMIPNNFAAMERLVGRTPNVPVGVTVDRFGNQVERQITGVENANRISDSASNHVSGLLEVDVDASSSVLNNFLSVGSGNQTVDRLVSVPEQFGGYEQKQPKNVSYEFKGTGTDSVGSANIGNDQGGIQ